MCLTLRSASTYPASEAAAFVNPLVLHHLKISALHGNHLDFVWIAPEFVLAQKRAYFVVVWNLDFVRMGGGGVGIEQLISHSLQKEVVFNFSFQS